MSLVPRFGISHMPISCELQAAALLRNGDNPSNWITSELPSMRE